MGKIKKVNILGTIYTLKEANESTDPKLDGNRDGYCDDSLKLCVVHDCKVDGIDAKGNLNEYKNQVIRHELIHAFLSESGLSVCSDWATNEEMVDWLAIQFPKLTETFKKLQVDT